MPCDEIRLRGQLRDSPRDERPDIAEKFIELRIRQRFSRWVIALRIDVLTEHHLQPA